MSEFAEILSILKEIRNNEDGSKNTGKSIFRKAKPAILNFPVIVSETISLTDLNMINKALEREYATVTRLAMGLDDIIKSSDSRSPSNKIDYIKKFHTNDYTSAGKSNLSALHDLFEESLQISNNTEVIAYNKKSLIAEQLGLNMKSLNSFTDNNRPNYLFSEAKIKTSSSEVTSNGISSSSTSSDSSTRKWDAGGANGGKKGNNSTSKSYAHNQGSTVVNNTDRSTRTDRRIETEYSTKTEFNDYSKQLLDNDIKKANELIPTTLDITVYQEVSNGTPGSPSEIITDHILLGIKCTSHKVNSNEMIENLIAAIERKKSFFNFIRWTTGEIKFFKDYLLCLDNIKKEALHSREKGNAVSWFRGLRNRSLIAKIRSTFNLKNQLIPNCTIVISMDEVDYVRNKYNIDLLNRSKINQIMNEYFLIGFVVVDNSQEIVHFNFDGFTATQSFSYNALERENRNQGNDIKSLVSLMSKF